MVFYYICNCVFMSSVAFFITGLSQTSSHQTSNWLQKGGNAAEVESQALFCLASLSGLQSGSWWHGAKCFWCLLLLDGLLGALCCFSLSLQEAEWHCDEFTKGACFSRGKSEVSLSDAWAFEMSHCYIALSDTMSRKTSFSIGIVKNTSCPL